MLLFLSVYVTLPVCVCYSSWVCMSVCSLSTYFSVLRTWDFSTWLTAVQELKKILFRYFSTNELLCLNWFWTGLLEACCYVAKQLAYPLKQHYVTLTATHCFKKQNLTMHVNTLHKTAILVKTGHILQRKCPLVFPLMLTTALSVCSLLI